MSTFSIIAFPMVAVGITMLAFYYKKKDKNYLIPGFVLLASGFVNAIIGLSLS